MGLLQDGKWVDEWYGTKASEGHFVRKSSQFRNWVTPEGDAGPIIMICAVSLIIHPAIVWIFGSQLNLTDAQLRSVVITAAMAPGINTYVFANLYGTAKRVASTGVLLSTALSIGTVWVWLSLLP